MVRRDHTMISPSPSLFVGLGGLHRDGSDAQVFAECYGAVKMPKQASQPNGNGDDVGVAWLQGERMTVCGEFRVRQRRVTDTSRGSETATDTQGG